MLPIQIASLVSLMRNTGIDSTFNINFQSQSAVAIRMASHSMTDEYEESTLSTSMYPDKGYMVKHFGYVHKQDGHEFDVKSAFNMDGEYIGNPELAEELHQRGIQPMLASPNHKVCSIGFCEKENKWYGWSHRAMYGFGIGSQIKKGDCAYSPATKSEFLQSLDSWYRDPGNNVKIIPTDKGAIVNVTSFRKTDGRPLHYEYVEDFNPGRGEYEVSTMDEAKKAACDFAESVSACAVSVDTDIIQHAVLGDLIQRFHEMSARMLTRANQLSRIQRFISLVPIEADQVPISADEAVQGAKQFHDNLKAKIANAPCGASLSEGDKLVNDSPANLGLTTRRATEATLPVGDGRPPVGEPPKDVEDVEPKVINDPDERLTYAEKLEALTKRHGNPNHIQQEITKSILDMFSQGPVASMSMESTESIEVLAETTGSRIERTVIHFDEYAPAVGTPYVIDAYTNRKSDLCNADLSQFKFVDQRCADIIHKELERQKQWQQEDTKYSDAEKAQADAFIKAFRQGVKDFLSGKPNLQSVSAAKFAPTEFAWFRYQGKKTRSFEHHKDRDVELEIETGERFGVMYNTRLKKYIIVEASMFGRNGEVWEFRADEKAVKLMVKASRPFAGKIGGQKVVKGDPLNLQLFTNRKQVGSLTVVNETRVEKPNKTRPKSGVKIVKTLDHDDVVDGVKIKRKPMYVGVFQPDANKPRSLIIVRESLTELKGQLQSTMEIQTNLGSFATIYRLRADNRFVVKAIGKPVAYINPIHLNVLERESDIKPEQFKGKNIRLLNDGVEVPQFKPGAPEFTEPMFFGNQENVLAEIRDAIVLDKYFSAAFSLLDPKSYKQKSKYQRVIGKDKPSERRTKMGIKELKSEGLVFLELIANHTSNKYEDEAYALLIRLREVFGKKVTGQVTTKQLKLDGVNKEHIVVRLIVNIKPVDKETKKRAIELYDLIESKKISIGINQYGVINGETMLPVAVVEPIYQKAKLKVQPTNMQLAPMEVSELYDLNGTKRVF